MTLNTLTTGSSDSAQSLLLQQLRAGQGNAATQSAGAPQFPPPPVGDDTSSDAASATTDSGLDSAASKLVSDLQGFLVSLQSASSATGTGAVSASTASAGTVSADAADATDTTAADSATGTGTDSLFADLSAFLGDLGAATGEGPSGGLPTAPSVDGAGDASATASSTVQSSTASSESDADPAQTALDQVLGAIQAYAAQAGQTTALSATTSLSV